MFGDFQSLKPNTDEHRIQPIEALQLINFLRADPPLFVHRCDLPMAFVLVGVGALLAIAWEAPGLWVLSASALLYPVARATGRLLSCTWVRRQVDRGLDMAVDGLTAQTPKLRRVK